MAEHDEAEQTGRKFRGQFMDVVHPSSDMTTAARPNNAGKKTAKIAENPETDEPDKSDGNSRPTKKDRDFIKEAYRESEKKFASIFMDIDDKEEKTDDSESVNADAVETLDLDNKSATKVFKAEYDEQEAIQPKSEESEFEPVGNEEIIPVKQQAPLESPFVANVAVNKRPLGAHIEPAVPEMNFEIDEKSTIIAMKPLPAEPEPLMNETGDNNQSLTQPKEFDTQEEAVVSEIDNLTAPATQANEIQDEILADTVDLANPVTENMPEPIMSEPESEPIPYIPSQISNTPPPQPMHVDTSNLDQANSNQFVMKPAKRKRLPVITWIFIFLILLAAGAAFGAWIYFNHPEWLAWLAF